MPVDLDPIVHNWYEHIGNSEKFTVVAIDDISGVVEIQHFDGALEEIDIEMWSQLEIETIEAPEDWTGSVDLNDRDDLGYTETAMDENDWSGSKEQKPNSDIEEEELDEWGEGFPEEESWQEKD